MLFGWRVVRHVKSNAIVYAGDGKLLGWEQVKCPGWTVQELQYGKLEAGLPLEGSTIASDAFFLSLMDL